MLKHADIIKELRNRTGSSLQDCINALIQTDYNVEEAIKVLRETGKAVLAKKNNRITAEGIVVYKCTQNNAFILSLKTETDFASRQESFQIAAQKIVEIISTSTNELALDNPDIRNTISDLALLLQENVQIGSVQQVQGAITAGYVHNKRIGAIISMESGDQELATNLAMHIVAYRPLAIERIQIDEQVIEKEKAIYRTQALQKSSNQSIQERIIEGKLESFFKESALLEQKYLLDCKKTVNQVLEDNSAKIKQFKLISL